MITPNNIDGRTQHIIHLKDGSIKYDFDKFGSVIDAIKADYADTPTDDRLRESISLCFSDPFDREVIFRKLKNKII